MPERSQLDLTQLDLTPTWLERIGRGFPPFGVGAVMQTTVRNPETDLDLAEVAASGGFAMRTLDRDVSLAFAEFLAGHAFTEEEIAELSATLVSDFEKTPAPSLMSMYQIADVINQIPGMDPELRASNRAKAMTLTVFHERDHGMSTSMLATIERYNRVLVVDAEARRILTTDAVDAFWGLYDLIAQIAGLPLASDDERLEFVASIDELYPRWSSMMRTEMAAMRVRWVGIRRLLRSMHDDQLDRFSALVGERAVDGPSVRSAVLGFGLNTGVLAEAHRVMAEMASRA